MNNHIKEIISKRIIYLEDNKHRIVIDGDTHPSDLDNADASILKRYNATPDYYQGRPISAIDLIREMNMAGIDMSLSWQNPAATVYVDGEDDNAKSINYDRLYKANKYVFDTANKYPQRIIPAGWTDPKALGVDLAKEMVKVCVEEFGFAIVKMNPAQNQYPLDSDQIFELVDYIIQLRAIPAFHYGGDTEFTPASALEKIAKTYPHSPIIGVHMGGGGSHYVEGDQLYIDSRALGLKYPNIFYILSAKRDCHIESDLITYQLAGEPYSRNIACASDAPYGRQAWNFGGYERLFQSLIDYQHHTDERVRNNPGLFNRAVKQNYLGTNLAELVIKGYKKMLSESEVFEQLSNK